MRIAAPDAPVHAPRLYGAPVAMCGVRGGRRAQPGDRVTCAKCAAALSSPRNGAGFRPAIFSPNARELVSGAIDESVRRSRAGLRGAPVRLDFSQEARALLFELCDLNDPGDDFYSGARDGVRWQIRLLKEAP